MSLLCDENEKKQSVANWLCRERPDFVANWLCRERPDFFWQVWEIIESGRQLCSVETTDFFIQTNNNYLPEAESCCRCEQAICFIISVLSILDMFERERQNDNCCLFIFGRLLASLYSSPEEESDE
jgi:hypothetical protein